MMDSFIAPSLQHSNTSFHLLVLTRLYPIAGLLAGYLLVMLANPVRRALRDGFRCIARYERVWLTFALLGFAYFVFQFVTFSSVPSPSEIDFAEIIAFSNWNWSPLADVWHEVPLPTIESVAGIFDNATTTYPLSALAAILFLVNWRGLDRTFWRALSKLYRWWSIPMYLVFLVSTLVLRLPMLLAYFINVPNVLDYLPLQRVFMSGFILAFCSVQISLVLHNETLREAFRAHRQLLRRDFRRLAWFCLICGLNFFLILVIDAMVRSAIADRAAAMIVWKSIFVFLRALVKIGRAHV